MRNRAEITKDQQPLHHCLEMVEFQGKMRPFWYRDVVQRMATFINSDTAQQAKQEGWLGYITHDGAISPFGLLAYIAETTAMQYWVIYNIKERRPAFCIEELRFDEDFNNWIRSRITKKNVARRGIIEITMRTADLEKIRRHHVKSN